MLVDALAAHAQPANAEHLAYQGAVARAAATCVSPALAAAKKPVNAGGVPSALQKLVPCSEGTAAAEHAVQGTAVMSVDMTVDTDHAVPQALAPSLN